MTCSVLLLSSSSRSSRCLCTFSKFSLARCNSASSSSSRSIPLLDDELGRDSLLLRTSWINLDSSFTTSDNRPTWQSSMIVSAVYCTCTKLRKQCMTTCFICNVSARLISDQLVYILYKNLSKISIFPSILKTVTSTIQHRIP
jgi:hypothetical protein